MNLSEIKPVQSQRVKGLVQSSEATILKNKYKPLIVDSEGYLVNGHHRYDAAHNLEMDKINVIEVNASIDELRDHFKDTASNRAIQESVGNIESYNDYSNTPKLFSWNDNNTQLNFIDVLQLFIKEDAQQFILHGLRFPIPDWQNSEQYDKYSVGKRVILQQAEKIGYGENRKITIKNELKHAKPPAGQQSLFSPDDTPVSGTVSERYPVFTKSEMTLPSKWFTFAISGSRILANANRIEKVNKERLRLKDKIEAKGPGSMNYKRDPDVIEYDKIYEQMIDNMEVIRTNIPVLFNELIKIKNELVNRVENPYSNLPSNENLETFLKDVLEDKIAFKAKKYQK
jgi:hypothetical protein